MGCRGGGAPIASALPSESVRVCRWGRGVFNGTGASRGIVPTPLLHLLNIALNGGSSQPWIGCVPLI